MPHPLRLLLSGRSVEVVVAGEWEVGEAVGRQTQAVEQAGRWGRDGGGWGGAGDSGVERKWGGWACVSIPCTPALERQGQACIHLLGGGGSGEKAQVLEADRLEDDRPLPPPTPPHPASALCLPLEERCMGGHE